MSSIRVCLVTICLGDEFLRKYNKLFRPSHEAYAKKQGYDFKIVTDYLGTKRCPSLVSLNKILACNGCEDYDFVLYIDSDVVINVKTAPPIHLEIESEEHRVGVVNQSQPTLEARYKISIYNKTERTAKEYYKLAGFDLEVDHILNTGCLLFQPKYHSDFMKKLYDKYETTQLTHHRGFHFEQACIGYELYTNNMVTFLDHKWNALWYNNKTYYNIINHPITLEEFFSKNYFLHLAGNTDHHLVSRLNEIMQL